MTPATAQTATHPGWCTGRHTFGPEDHWGMLAGLGVAEGLLVFVTIRHDKRYSPEPSLTVHVGGTRTTLPDADAAERQAALLEALGHPAIAAALREGIAALNGGGR